MILKGIINQHKSTCICDHLEPLGPLRNLHWLPVAYLAYLVRGGKQRHRSIFRIGGGGGGGGVKVRKMPNFSARFARKVAISNFSRKARRKNENCVYLVVFLC